MYIVQSKYTKLCYSFLVPIHVCSFHSFSNFFHRQADTPKKHFLQFTLFILLLCTAIYSFLLLCTARIMISILVLNPFSVLHLSFPLFLISFILAPIVLQIMILIWLIPKISVISKIRNVESNCA